MSERLEDHSEGFLDQSEIDRLLAETPPETPTRHLILRADGTRGDERDASRIEAYDFRNPAFLSEDELRQLRLIQEDFVRYLSARLSLFLRMEFGLKMAKLTTVPYEKFTESLPSPTHISLFKVEQIGRAHV